MVGDLRDLEFGILVKPQSKWVVANSTHDG